MEDQVSTVTSEINPYTERDKAAIPTVAKENVVSKFTFTYPESFWGPEITHNTLGQPKTEQDDDGDLVVVRGNGAANKEGIISIEHSISTVLSLVGLQVWRGALLLSDYILHTGPALFQNRTVLELGSGVGLSSIVAGMFAKEVICTDVDRETILELIGANAERNKHLLRSRFYVEEIDFFDDSWRAKIADKMHDISLVIAADVIYDDRLSDAFVDTLRKLVIEPPSKIIFIALEKRYVFTVDDFEAVAPCHDYFLQKLTKMCEQVTRNTPCRMTSQEIPIDFPQYFSYERVKELVLWKVTSTY